MRSRRTETARRRGQRPRRRKGPDPFRWLFAAFGFYAGLVLFSLIWPPAAAEAPGALKLAVRDLAGSRAQDGRFAVRGRLLNEGAQACREALVRVRFLDAQGAVVARTTATARGIGPWATADFTTQAHAPSAVRCEVLVLAAFP